MRSLRRAEIGQGRLARVYSFVTGDGDVSIVARRGRWREIWLCADGSETLWLADGPDLLAPSRLIHDHVPDFDAAIRWLATGAA